MGMSQDVWTACTCTFSKEEKHKLGSMNREMTICVNRSFYATKLWAERIYSMQIGYLTTLFFLRGVPLGKQ